MKTKYKILFIQKDTTITKNIFAVDSKDARKKTLLNIKTILEQKNRPDIEKVILVDETNKEIDGWQF